MSVIIIKNYYRSKKNFGLVVFMILTKPLGLVSIEKVFIRASYQIPEE
jgi:hypothetical protein